MGRRFKDVRLQVYVSSKMDDQIDDMAEIMGLSKHEFIRYTLANAINAQNQTVEVLKELVQKELEK